MCLLFGFLYKLGNGSCQSRKRSDLTRNDDLRSLAVCRLLKRLKTLYRDDLVGRSGFVYLPDALGSCLLNLEDSLCLTCCLLDCCLLLCLCAKDGCLLFSLGIEDD